MKQAGGLKLKPKAGAKPARAKGADADEKGDDKIREPAAKLRVLTFKVPTDERVPVLALLNRRHYDWLVAVGRLEGRTPEAFLDRLVRLAWSHDSSKGGKFSDALGRDGRSGGSAGDGLTGSHPIAGGGAPE